MANTLEPEVAAVLVQIEAAKSALLAFKKEHDKRRVITRISLAMAAADALPD